MLRNVALAGVLFAFAGCGVELLTTTATVGKLQADNMKAIKRNTAAIGNQTAETNIRHAISLYQAEKGRTPTSLDELVPGYLPSIPAKSDGTPFYYNPATGQLVDGPVAVPAGPTANDQQKLAQIQQAIHRYGTAVGYYPPSLQSLVPTYLSEVPKTDSGQDFVFNPQTGALYHPAQGNAGMMAAAPVAPAAPAPTPSMPRPVGVSGAGPMGEAMTGIGIQNQLNSNSNAGSSAAGSYMRQSVGGATSQHNQQQEQTMNQLGL